MQFKEGVKIKGLQPEILAGILVCKSIFEAFKISFIITSVTDGKHSEGSLHYKGLAFDIRSKHILNVETKRAILAEIKLALTDEFDVILESLGLEQEHYHVEYDPK